MTTTATITPSVGDADLDESTPSRWIAWAALPILLVVMMQRFGEIVYLTRVDRILDPVTAATRAWDLWNPFADMGAVQWQQNGYWIPFDAWFALTRLLHVPTWVSERLFISGLIVVAFWGFTRLADSLKIGVPRTRIIAAYAYALSPVILARIGWQSPFAMGTIFLPLVLLPLVRGSRRGSTRTAAARSVIPLALMGGVNAAVTLAVLPVPVLYLLTRQRGPRRASLLRWWILFVPLATLWWGVGLYFFGRYGPDFLQYTETVATTTAPTSLFNVLRGTADWIAGLPGPANPSSFSLALKSIPIAGTAILAGIGLAGLARRGIRERTFLIACLTLGVATVGGAYSGLFASPASSVYSGLLDTVLSAFRNVYKFQPLITLPVALGIAHVLLTVRFQFQRQKAGKVIGATMIAALLAVSLAATWPLWTNRLTRGSGFATVPSAWKQAGDWLTSNAAGRVLVVPGIPDADFEWGFTSQIPIEWESGATWAARSQAPLSGLTVIDYLDAVETAIERGGSTNLEDFLRRGGFSTIVVPNDQRSARYVAPEPESVRNALDRSGLRRIAEFGERKFGYGELPQIDIYEVAGGAVATTYARDAVTWLTGDISAPLDIPESIFGDRAYLLTAGQTSTSIEPSQWIVTDTNTATTTDFGPNRNTKSYIHSAADDDPPDGRLTGDRTVLDLGPVTSVSASSVGPGIFVKDIPNAQPLNAVDGDRATWWEPLRQEVDGPNAFGTTDPWFEITYGEPQMVDSLFAELFVGPYAVPNPIDVTVVTDAGRATTRLLPIQTSQELDVVPGPTRTIRVSISRASYLALDDAIGIRELSAPLAPVRARLAVPTPPNDRSSNADATDPAWVFTRLTKALSPLVSLSRETQISRRFTSPRAMRIAALASGSSTRGQQLLDWIGTSPTLTIQADSTWGENPKASPRNLVDGDESTQWRSGKDINQNGGIAVVSLRWNEPRTISSLRLVRSETDAAPTDIAVYSRSGARGAPVAADGTVTFAPLTTDAISLRINYAPVLDTDRTALRQMGFVTLDIESISDLYPGPIDPTAPYIATCGTGPTVTVGSTTVRYSLATSVGALLDGTTIPLEPCGSNEIDLAADTAFLDTSSGESLVTIDQVVLGRPPTMAPPTGTARGLTIDHWGTNDRTVTVADGGEGLLVVNEAFNDGWTASLNGTALTPILIDGWRQGFVLPTGVAGSAHLVFGPDRPFKVGTALGLLALLIVLSFALRRDRRPVELDAAGEGSPSRPLLVTAMLVGGVWCTGIGVILLAPLWWVRARRRSWLAPLALAAMSTAGVLAVVGKRVVEYRSELWGVTSYPVNGLAALALLCVLVTLLPDRDHRSQPADTRT